MNHPKGVIKTGHPQTYPGSPASHMGLLDDLNSKLKRTGRLSEQNIQKGSADDLPFGIGNGHMIR